MSGKINKRPEGLFFRTAVNPVEPRIIKGHAAFEIPVISEAHRPAHPIPDLHGMIVGRCIRPSSESIKSYLASFYFRAFGCFLPHPEFTGNKDCISFFPDGVDFFSENLSGSAGF